jgi:flagellar motility protein MotE (MotC chaperone)
MKDIIKIIVISIVFFILVTAGLVFGIPSVRKGVMAKMSAKKTAEVTPEVKEMQVQKEEKDNLIKMLKEKEEDLKKREDVVVQEEKRLSSLKTEVTDIEKSVSGYQDNIEKYVVRLDESKQKNLKKLAGVFSKMAVEDAGEIIAGLNDNTVVSILVFMKDRNSAQVLGAYARRGKDESSRAARLSEMLKKVVLK